MEEENELALLDYRTPKGQLIKLLEQKIKKPEIDDSLGKVLDQFIHMTREQTTFLDNGIFHMNFAEDALLLQSCGQYYAKRVDKLWDELLQFHTRMVKYDEATAKNSTDRGKKEARKLELEKLEERLNRGKRKKIRLTEPETETPQNGCYVFEVDQNAGQELFDRVNLLQEDVEEQVVPPFEHNFEIFDDWREIHQIDELEKKKRGSVVVSQYNKQKYRLKNYTVPNGDEIIYDWKDPEEFNTREGRLVSVHHIRHLFEYNDRCLLPDEDFTIAKLRFAYVLKKKWLVQHKIDPDAPYETYKAEYEKYQREYFENEKKKIQNMPQRNSEDLMKFYKALEKKEQLAKQAQEKLRQSGVKNLPDITFESLILDPLKEGYQGDYDSYIPTDDESHPERSVQIPIDGDHELELSNLFVDIPKLPDSSAEAADKLRSDSGYFDGGFEADDESDREDNTDASVLGTDTPFEFDKDNTENKEMTVSVLSPRSDSSLLPKGEETAVNTTLHENKSMETELADESSINVTEDPETAEKETMDVGSTLEPSGDTSLITLCEETQESATPVPPEYDAISIDQEDSSCIEDQELVSLEIEAMNREIREFAKLGTEDENISCMILENCFFKKTDDFIMILYNKEGEGDLESIDEDSQLDQIIDLGTSVEKLSKNKVAKKSENDGVRAKSKDAEKEESKKRKLEACKIDNPPPKRRKLSQKQIEKLRKSLIEPVKELKWEFFFSMNYQTEAGEGEISRIDYESESEDEAHEPDDDNQDDLDHIDEQCDKIETLNDLNVSGYHSDHDLMHESDRCRSETPAVPLTQDSGIDGMDLSTNNLSGCPDQPETETVSSQATPLSKETNPVELGSIDLIAELSKNIGLSCEELADQEARKSEKTQHEQQREQMRDRVAEWKEHMGTKLKKLDEHDFDIHDYGSKIMDSMNVDESKHFGDLMVGKSSAEVVRYFISSLQLANTMNVEICGAKKGELSNDTFELKLLSKERYHEHLQEYQAPSEEGLLDKLKKVKQIRMQNKMQAKSLAKRKSIDVTTTCQNRTQQIRPQSIMKRTTERSKIPSENLLNDSTVNVSPSKKIKILNYNILRATDQPFDFQQPSTSWQADMTNRQSQLRSPTSDELSPLSHTPTRSSIDSGFMPSCDEDFLDQFDQLQQTTDAQLRSTPVRPRKVLRVSFARNTNF